jgi:hypothetical protein
MHRVTSSLLGHPLALLQLQYRIKVEGGISVLHKQTKIQVADCGVEKRDWELRTEMGDRYGAETGGREREAENIEMPCPVVVIALHY